MQSPSSSSHLDCRESTRFCRAALAAWTERNGRVSVALRAATKLSRSSIILDCTLFSCCIMKQPICILLVYKIEGSKEVKAINEKMQARDNALCSIRTSVTPPDSEPPPSLTQHFTVLSNFCVRRAFFIAGDFTVIIPGASYRS
jgi:hypothetical protein